MKCSEHYLQVGNGDAKTIRHNNGIESRSCQHYMRSGNKIIKHTVAVSRKRDSFHGVDNMLVKSRKKSEAVFTRKRIIIHAGIFIRNRNTSGFSTRQPYFSFENLHFKPTLY